MALILEINTALLIILATIITTAMLAPNSRLLNSLIPDEPEVREGRAA